MTSVRLSGVGSFLSTCALLTQLGESFRGLAPDGALHA